MSKSTHLKKTSLPKALMLAITGLVLWNACNPTATENIQSPTEKTGIASYSGEKLAHIYCAGCHLYNPPEMLPKDIWKNNIFPAMGPMMGIYSHRGKSYSTKGLYDQLNRDLYPLTPRVDAASWQKMIDFYVAKSPAVLSDTPPPSPLDTVSPSPFRIKDIQLTKVGPEATSLVKIDRIHHRLYWANALLSTFSWMNWNTKAAHSIRLPSAPVSLDNHTGDENKVLVTCIGSLAPSDRPLGSLVSVNLDSALTPHHSYASDISTQLPRPVQILSVDLDKDGENDYLVCGFGHMKGCLFWMKKNGNNFEKRILRNTPGAIHAIIEDVNHDGLPDIWVLFAQSREGISLFINKGNGAFSEQKILEFPPVQGSSSFELADMNGDGLEDIIYTCGDNADYSPILKNFHGVYIFTNQGKNIFKQAYFYPIHGCYKAVIADFDLDGKPDMVTIGYFADFAHRPSETLVYFNNLGNLRFHSIRPAGYNKGRWLTMDVGDMDGDGDADILLGNFALGPSDASPAIKKTWNAGNAFTVLENKTR